MPRPKVRDVSPASEIVGIARPVNTYVRPADPAPSSLHDVAEGLAALDSGLAGFMSERKGKSDEKDKQRAIHAFNTNNAQSWSEAVRNGSVPANASPVFQEWYKRSQGELMGRRLRDQFKTAFNSWEGRNGNDPEAFNTFLGGFLKENIGDQTDADILAGLNPHVEQLFEDGFSTFSAEGNEAVTKKALATQGALITDDLERTVADGKANGSVDWDAFWTRTVENRQIALDRGVRAADYDAHMVEAIILEAERQGDDEILKLLDRKVPGSDHALSSEVAVKDKILQAQTRIDNKLASESTAMAAARERMEKLEHNKMVGGVIDTLARDPRAAIDEDTLTAISRRDPEFKTKLKEYRERLVGTGAPEDPEALILVYSDIHAGKGEDFVTEMWRQGVITSPETFTKAMDRVKKVQDASKEGGVLNSPTYRDLEALITSQTAEKTKEEKEDGIVLPGGLPGLSKEGQEALFDYRNILLQWAAQNPKAKMMEREKAINEIGQSILARITHQPHEEFPVYDSEADRAKRANGGQETSEDDPADAPGAQPEQPETDGLDEIDAGSKSWKDFIPKGVKGALNPLGAAKDTLLDVIAGDEEPSAENSEFVRRLMAQGLSEDDAKTLYKKHLERLGAVGPDATTSSRK